AHGGLELPEQTTEGTEGAENCNSKNKQLLFLFRFSSSVSSVFSVVFFKPFDRGDGDIPSGRPPRPLR
ncbi:MAG TPA: hypothetical protein VFI52_18315, partial [Gemmatimonadaceae bacterium]|nr:hypothetical protein [Gemmatimonadaceae bacterium]